jgi:hypothetical protein
MSRKQFISAEAHLAKFGVTVQQALDFIIANIDQPEVIYVTAREYGVTQAMLHEITDAPASVIDDYFTGAGFDPGRLDHTSILFNTDIGLLEDLVERSRYRGETSLSNQF